MVIPAGGVTTGHVKVILVALTETPVGARWSGRLWYQHFPVGIHTSITPRESVTSVYVFPFIDKVRVLLLFLYRLLPGTSHIWNPSEPLRPLPEDSKRVFALSTVKLPSDSLESKFWSPWNSALIKWILSSNSRLTSSKCVQIIPCGPSFISTYRLPFMASCRRLPVASMGRIRSASPWIMSVGISIRARSFRKEVWYYQQACNPVWPSKRYCLQYPPQAAGY